MMLLVIAGLVANSERRIDSVVKGGWKGYVRRIVFPIFRKIGKENLYTAYYKLLSHLPKNSSCADDLWDRFYLLDGSFHPGWFDDLELYEFEGYTFCAFRQADIFLRNHYGNYMECPPLDKRVPHHNYEAYLL